jgi:hypothetical protein
MAVSLTVPATSVGRAVVNLIRVAKNAQCRRRERIESRATRGIVLLREWLSLQQREQFDYYNFFEVIGCDSGKSYRIQHGVSTNVIELDRDGRPRTGWCFVPEGNLVAGDVMLAQKIALETDERGALAIARQFLVPSPLHSELAPTV